MAERKPFLLRIDPALWSDLEAWAQAELRSVNGQIEYLLKQAVLRRKQVLRSSVPESPSPESSVSSQPSARPGPAAPQGALSPSSQTNEAPPAGFDPADGASDVGWL